MRIPEPQPCSDRDLLAALIGELLADPTTTLLSASSLIVDEQFKPTGKRAWKVVLEGTVEPVPAQFYLIDPMCLQNAQTSDGSLVIAQEFGAEDGYQTIRSKITIFRRENETDEDFATRGSMMYSRLPISTGFSRQFYSYVPVYDEEHTTCMKTSRIDIDMTDKETPLQPAFDVINDWIEKARNLMPKVATGPNV